MINRSDLRKKILLLVEQYGDDKSDNTKFVEGKTVIPPSGKFIGGNEMKMMTEAVLDGWLTTGRFNDQFENKIAQYLGVRHVLTTNSGSSANLLAFSALTSDKLGERRIKSGDEVITVAVAFPTTVNPIIQNNCIPVFVDVDIPTYNIDVGMLEEALSEKTRAIMLAHTLGNPFNVEAVKDFADKNNLWLIEDCCDALGSEYKGRKVGSFGDIGTVSFYPAHHITTGEGGAVFTNNTKLKKIIESFRDWGRDCYCKPGLDNTCNNRFSRQLGKLPNGYDHKYTYSHIGYNLKITDMQAACGLAQFDRLEYFTKTRKDNFQYFTEKLKLLERYLILPKATKYTSPSWFGYPIIIKENIDMKLVDLVAYLDKFNIGSRLIFAGNITKQPYFNKCKFKIIGTLDNTDLIMNKGFWLGVYPGIDRKKIDYVVNKLNDFLSKID
jgi:CDP-4-dehydro-6-deoxyglucose reductase, E1